MARTLLTPVLLLALTTANAVTVSVSVTDARCGQANGGAVATANGGLPPYTYSWDNGATGATLSGVLPGSYVVTVTDGLANTAQATAVINNIPDLGTPNSQTYRADCAGSCSGWAGIYESDLQGTPPYTYDFPFPQQIAGMTMFLGVCAWQPTPVNVTDATGCPGTFDLMVWDSPMGYPEILDNTPACGAQSNGSITVNGSWSGYAAFNIVPPGFFGPGQVFEFQNAPYTISGLAAGDYEIYLWDPIGYIELNIPPGPIYCTGQTAFTIGSLPEPCGTLTGNVYHDADQNCVFNGFDLKEPYRVITMDPTGDYAITDGLGHYQQNVNYGTYDLSQSLPANETQICPVVSPQPATVDAANTNVNTDFSNLSTVPHDLSLSIWSSAARPGFPTHLWLSVTNWTAFPSGDVDVDVTFDPLLLNPSPASGHWDVGVMPPYSQQSLELSGQVPANINLLGTVMNYSATVTNTATEASLANNTASLAVTITGSYDPNDKQGITSSGLSNSQYFLTQDEWIDYTVRFQNTGTAAATTVTIRDTIDEDLFIPSLEILGASHDFTPSFGQGRELVFTFDNINLPDSTTDLLGSQGFISFRLKPNDDIIVGDELDNTAAIYFDLNPPIITNTVSHVVDFSTGVRDNAVRALRVVPNPASNVVNVILPEGAGTALQLLSVDGRVIEVPVMRKADNLQLDVNALSPGTYVIRTDRGCARLIKH